MHVWSREACIHCWAFLNGQLTPNALTAPKAGAAGAPKAGAGAAPKAGCVTKAWIDGRRVSMRQTSQPTRQLLCRTGDLNQMIHMHADACVGCILHTGDLISRDQKWLARSVRNEGKVSLQALQGNPANCDSPHRMQELHRTGVINQ